MGELAVKPIVLVAMGGHAFMQKGEKGTIEEHERNAVEIARLLMTLVEKEYQLVITHGNGPQVGTLLLQQECSPQFWHTSPPAESAIASAAARRTVSVQSSRAASNASVMLPSRL